MRRATGKFEMWCGAALMTAAVTVARGQIIAWRPMPPVVTVQVGASGTVRVPATLFGTFLEPIGDSINHGIDAEILTNGSLEAGLWNHTHLEAMFDEQPELIDSTLNTGIPLPWQPLDAAAGNRYELHVGQAANSWQSLELIGTTAGQTGIMQQVYLPVQRELSYNVSLYVKHVSGPAGVVVMLREVDSGKTLAVASVEASAPGWTKYSATLQLQPGAVQRLEAVDFAVAVQGTGRAEVDEISLMPEDAIGILDPDAVAMAKAMHATELRLGGNFSSYYHWQDGMGPADKRRTMENIAWGIPEYNKFGTDEFLQLCRLMGATPQIDVNMGSGTPQEAAAWVRYIHEHYQGRTFFELGNELYGKWQVGYKTVSEIAADTVAFSQAVRAADPDAVLIATGDGPLSNGNWNAAQLGTPPGTFDDLSLHFILGTNHPALAGATPDFTAAAAYALPYAVGPYFDTVEAQVKEHPELAGKVHLAVTEWLFNSRGYGERNFTDQSPSWMNQGGAVMAAGFLNTLIRHADTIDVADMTGLMEFAGIWKKREQVYAVPAYYVFRMYTAVKGDSVLPVTTDSGTYDLAGGVRPLDQVTGIPWVDVAATRSADGRTVTLLCVNRSLNEDVPLQFVLQGMRVNGPAAAQQISAASRYERNSEVEPNHIVPEPITVNAPGSGPLAMTLPHDSVTVLRVPVQ